MSDRDARIVALGDSTTAGTPGFASPLEAPPDGAGDATSQYAWWLMARRPGWQVLNRGVNGERSDQIAARFARDVLDDAPDLVVILAGVNDVYQGRAPEAVVPLLGQMYRRAVDAGIAVVAATILPFDTATTAQNAAMRAINAWIARQGASIPAVWPCDTRRAVSRPDEPDRLLATPDTLHPSPEGYRLMALALEPVIAAALATRLVSRPGARRR